MIIYTLIFHHGSLYSVSNWCAVIRWRVSATRQAKVDPHVLSFVAPLPGYTREVLAKTAFLYSRVSLVSIFKAFPSPKKLSLSTISCPTQYRFSRGKKNMIDGGTIAVLAFLWTTVRRHWCKALVDDIGFAALRDALLDDLSSIREDLSALRDADKQVAVSRFVRGIELLMRNPAKNETAWKDDLSAALDSAEQGYHRVKSTAHRILCFEIMCSCFLVLRNRDSAVISIQTQMTNLFREKEIQRSLRSLRSCIRNGKPLLKEEKELLELFFSRVCGIIAACQTLDCDKSRYRCEFRNMFASVDSIREATDPAFMVKWDDAVVYKFNSTTRIAGTAAHAILPIVPVMAATVYILTLGLYRPKKAWVNTFDTVKLKPTKQDDESKTPQEYSLYDFRWKLLDLSHCKCEEQYEMGSVQVLLVDPSTNVWQVKPLNSHKPKLLAEEEKEVLVAATAGPRLMLRQQSMGLTQVELQR